MEPIEATTEPLRWVRSEPHHRAFDLRSGDAAVAALRWKTAVGSLAEAEAAGIQWTLKRRGFVHPHVELREAGSEALFARLNAHLGTSVLELPGAPSLRWRRTHLLVPSWQFSDERGRALVTFSPVLEGTKLQGALLEVANGVPRDRRLLLLLFVGWYFIVLSELEDQALAVSSKILEETA